MHVVGSDRIRVTAGRVQPDGPLHAVDRDGQVSCRDRGAFYRFPAMTWPGADDIDNCCADCIRIVRAERALSHLDSYPTEAGNLLVPDSIGF